MADPLLTPQQATAEVRRRVKLSDLNIRWTDHVLGDKRAPRDFAHKVSDDEVRECLNKGSIKEPGELDMKHDTPVYRMVHEKTGYAVLVAIVIPMEKNQVVVISRYKQKRYYRR